MSDTIKRYTRPTRTERIAIVVANWIIRTFAPETTKFTRGAIEYGMRAAARDSREGIPFPPDWRK